MAEKSILLSFLTLKASNEGEQVGVKDLTPDFFMVAALRTVGNIGEKNTYDINLYMSPEDVGEELNSLSELVASYTDTPLADADKIIRAVSQPDYDNSSTVELYLQAAKIAEVKAKREGLDVIDSCMYINFFLAQATPAIGSIVFHTDEEESSVADAQTTTEEEQSSAYDPSRVEEARSRISELMRGLDGEEEDAAEQDSDEEATGIDALSGVLDRTRRVQRYLLDRVYGQDQAVNTFVSGYFQSELTALTRKGVTRPQATFLFAGPPGVGKTFLAETAAAALGLPFCRFDMSEYSDKEANIEFCGSDKVYKNAKAGNVTSFVAEHPKCVLLFDEIEKAHINVIYLFLQLLDAGRLRDNFTDEEVSFTNAVIIFTTNAGKNLYTAEEGSLSSIPRKKILKALSTDLNPATGQPLFPAAICSRFASGNVVMFNHLTAHDLLGIAEKELTFNARAMQESTGIDIRVDPLVSSVLLLSEGGNADARTVKGRTDAFFHEELYELLRLIVSEKNGGNVKNLRNVDVRLLLESASPEILSLFVDPQKPSVLIFAEPKVAEACRTALPDMTVYAASDRESAKDILFNHDISVILCDLYCGSDGRAIARLNLEDVSTAGRDFFLSAVGAYNTPVYIFENNEGDVSEEEFLSFARDGAAGLIPLHSREKDFAVRVSTACDGAYCQATMHRLAGAKKVLTYRTAQSVTADGHSAVIELTDFRLSLAADVEDTRGMIDTVARPNVRFADVIGATDAKAELAYFVDYLRNPINYVRRGLRAPKGLLLYGPPGTGKTLLAKAMAGESNVTFIAAEGNQFLKRYVGEGADAVHELFTVARKYAPSILFIDEIDAIGKDRNISSGGGGDTADVLTAFLTEMDGFNTDTTKPVFVLAATNYEVEPGHGKTLDAALLRRFDRRVMVDLPDKDGRARYIRMKLGKNGSLRLSDAQIDNVALRSTGMSLAELESVIELALRSAVRTQADSVTDAIFDEAFETFNSGEKKHWDAAQVLRTARHEAGHALICWLKGETPAYMTIVSRGDHGGYMQHGDTESRFGYTRRELLDRICTSMGGRAAELVCYGSEDGMTTGPSGDLQSATRIARRLVCTYGMDTKLGMASLTDQELLSTRYGDEVIARVNDILDEQLDEAVRVVRENRAALDALVAVLTEKNHLKGEEIDAILSANAVTPRRTAGN